MPTPMESQGATLWGASISPGDKNAYTVDIDEDCVAVLSGICLDSKADKDFRATVVIKSTAEDGQTKSFSVACISYGQSENVSIEVPLYKGDQVICNTKQKGQIHVFGSVAAVEEDLGDVMDSDYAEQIANMLPTTRLDDEDEDDDSDEENQIEEVTSDAEEEEEESESEEEKPKKKNEIKIQDMEEEDSDEDEEEEEMAEMLKERFNGRVKNVKKAAPENLKQKKRKLSESESSVEKKKSKSGGSSEVSKESFVKDVKSWLTEGSSELSLPDLGMLVNKKYKKGFAKLGFGTKMGKFLNESGQFKVKDGKVSLK